MLTPVIPRVTLRAQATRKRRHAVGSPGGYDTGEGRWGQPSKSVILCMGWNGAVVA